MSSDPFATPADHDRRYAHVVTFYEVYEIDGDEFLLLRTANRADADRVVNAHRAPDICTIKEIPLATYSPGPRPLYELQGPRIDPDPAVPVPPRPEPFDDVTAIPGWARSPEALPLERPSGSVYESVGGGWRIDVEGWDRDQVLAEYERLLAVALEARTQRWESFRPYTDRTVVRQDDGAILVRRVKTSSEGRVRRYWESAGRLIDDRDIDPRRLTILVPGAAAAEDGTTP